MCAGVTLGGNFWAKMQGAAWKLGWEARLDGALMVLQPGGPRASSKECLSCSALCPGSHQLCCLSHGGGQAATEDTAACCNCRSWRLTAKPKPKLAESWTGKLCFLKTLSSWLLGQGGLQPIQHLGFTLSSQCWFWAGWEGW